MPLALWNCEIVCFDECSAESQCVKDNRMHAHNTRVLICCCNLKWFSSSDDVGNALAAFVLAAIVAAVDENLMADHDFYLFKEEINDNWLVRKTEEKLHSCLDLPYSYFKNYAKLAIRKRIKPHELKRNLSLEVFINQELFEEPNFL